MIRRCEGPHGEPGYLWEDPDGTQTQCFWWDPNSGNNLDGARALRALSELIKGKVTGAEQPAS